jgi:hypothetical protein
MKHQTIKDLRDGIAGALGGVAFGLCIFFFIALAFGYFEPVPNCKPGHFINCIQGARR